MFSKLFIGASPPQKADKTTPLAVKTAGATAVFILEPATESAVSGMPSQNHKKTVLADGFLMAGVTGLEPATSCVTGRRSNQLSYTPIQVRFPLYLTFFFIALKHKAVSIILLHNHPSGDPSPSKDDLVLTKRMADTGSMIGIPLLDHIVIGDNRYISLRESGYLS